ncbi:MAG: GNAT family N-acetyltransferase [Chloroflexi bacterium]|nr:GNAT family N-acetyltransferase [Chloroflexota bacterium]
MPDMLVPLYRLPAAQPLVDQLRERGIIVRRANAFEITAVRGFITSEFSAGWADEATVGFASHPVTTYLAIEEGLIVGFGSYECTRRAFFGPTGVAPSHRKQGIGAALLLRCLEGLRDMNYGYAIIGGAGPTAFYERACGAVAIPDSIPGVYTDLLKRRP